MNIDEVIKRVEKVEGWFDEGQMRALKDAVLTLNKGDLLVELGSFHGRSTHYFSLLNPDIRVLTIDVCEQYEVNAKIPTSIDKEVLVAGNIFQVAGKSEDVVKRFNWQIDFLFIDTRHTYEQVRDDIITWTPFVKKGGYIAFHDYDKGFPGVIRACDEWLQNNSLFVKVKADCNILLAKRT